MSGIFSSMNTATKGLMASQTALHTTGHNISNVNTEGFTRQRVDMQADRAFNLAGVGQLGTGVRMQAVVRMVNDHVSKQIRQENSTLNRFTEKSEVIDQLEVIFNEPSDTGLNFNISEMFSALQNLGENPENVNFKTVAVEKFKTLTDNLNHMANQIGSLEGETHDAIDKNVLDFNSTVEALNTLNKQIFNVSIKGQVPNDLLDQRDMLLKDLSAIGDVEIDLTDPHGRVGIKMAGVDADNKPIKSDILTVEGGQKFIAYDKFDKDKPDAIRGIKLYDTKDKAETNDGTGTSMNIQNGKIKGNIDAIEDVKVSSQNLDKLAKIMAKSMNEVHTKGGTGNLEIFTSNDKGETIEITAKNIRVNKAIKDDVTNLKTGKPDADGKVNEGDGSLAADMAKLRNTKISLGKPVVDANGEIVADSDGNTIGGTYRDTVIKIGISKQHSDNMVKNQEVLSNQLENRRESVSGVSLNDEITNVMKFQKAYEANAKVISVLTDMLDVLINRTGV